MKQQRDELLAQTSLNFVLHFPDHQSDRCPPHSFTTDREVPKMTLLCDLATFSYCYFRRVNLFFRGGGGEGDGKSQLSIRLNAYHLWAYP